MKKQDLSFNPVSTIRKEAYKWYENGYEAVVWQKLINDKYVYEIIQYDCHGLEIAWKGSMTENEMHEELNRIASLEKIS